MQSVSNNTLPKEIIAGISITLLLIFGSITALLVPLPILYYRIKIGRKNTLMIPAVIILILSVVSQGPMVGILFFSGWMILGFLLGECYELRLPIEKTILFSCITVILSGCVLLIFYSNVTHTGIYDMAFGQVSVFINHLVDTGMLESAPDDLVHTATSLIPGVIITMVVFIAWINVVLSLPLFRKGGLTVPNFGPLDQWKAPDYLVWLVIFTTTGLLVPAEPLKILCLNLMSIMMLIYFLQGVSIVVFFVKKTNIPVILRALLYWFVFFQFPFNLLVTGIGFFDTWVDFRKRSFKQDNRDDKDK